MKTSEFLSSVNCYVVFQHSLNNIDLKDFNVDNGLVFACF